MRTCIRCKSEMIENCRLRVSNGFYGLVVDESEKLFANPVGKVKMAVCPECGEISIYLDEEDVRNLEK